MDLFAITKQSSVTSRMANRCGSFVPELLGYTNYAGRSQISDQLAKAVSPESVYGGNLIEAATVNWRPPRTSGAK